MAGSTHTLPFKRVFWPTFPSAERLAEDVRVEKSFWEKFEFQPIGSSSLRPVIPQYDQIITEALAGEFGPDRNANSWHNSWVLPHRTSAEGKMLVDLINMKDLDAATSLTLAIYAEEGWELPRDSSGDIRSISKISKVAEGRALLNFERLGFLRNSSTAKEEFENQRNRLENEVVSILKLKDENEDLLSDVRDVNSLIRSEALRGIEVQKRWVRRWHSATKQKVSSERARLESEWNALKRSYVDELKFKAPIQHWKEVEAGHEFRANLLLGIFVLVMTALAMGSSYISYYHGDDIAQAFRPVACPPIFSACNVSISPKGPLLIGSVLLVTSLSIWLLRLLNKMHLSERHLARAAAEKRSFTEAFLALSKQHTVNEAHEAIVMAAIFRPSQDGFVKDDDAGIDLSSPALLARAFSGKQ